MSLSESAAWRSTALGDHGVLGTSQGSLGYHSCGVGRPIVFVHGWLANANLWRKVVPELKEGFRCISLDMPLGGHTTPMSSDADLTPIGCGRLVIEALDQLDLNDVVLVGNDSGGAYSQIATATEPARIGALVLTTCETPYDTFPPTAFVPVKKAAEAHSLRAALTPLKHHAARTSERAFGRLIKRLPGDDVFDSYCLPLLEDDGILADAEKAWGSASETYVAEAGAKLISNFKRPVLFTWATEDIFFSLENARRFAGELHDGRIEPISDSFSFTPEDKPKEIASLIGALAAEKTGA
jgi:pimeloyl-ACP methyl ester carboxylesterase